MLDGCAWAGSTPARDLQYTKQVQFIAPHHHTVAQIDVAVADGLLSRMLGLMYVQDMPADKGMLFKYNQAKPRHFWMANTPLPLDILFVDSQRRIIHIHHHAKPYSHSSIASQGDAQYVVETNAGFAKKHHLQPGMLIRISSS